MLLLQVSLYHMATFLRTRVASLWRRPAPLHLLASSHTMSFRSHSTTEASGAGMPTPAGLVSRFATRLAKEPGVDGALFAMASLLEDRDAALVDLTEPAAAAAFAECVRRMGEASRPAPLLAALTHFVSRVTPGDLTAGPTITEQIWDAFAVGALARTDASLAVRLVTEIVRCRAVVAPATLRRFVDAHAATLASKQQKNSRFAVRQNDKGVFVPEFPPFNVPLLSDNQWTSVLSSVASRCRAPVSSQESLCVVACHADTGNVKAAFVEFDRYEKLLREEGTALAPPSAFEPLFRVCASAGHVNRCLKLLKLVERNGEQATTPSIQSVVSALCADGQVAIAIPLLLSTFSRADLPSEAAVLEAMSALGAANRGDDVIAILKRAQSAGLLTDIDLHPRLGVMNLSGVSEAVIPILVPYLFKQLQETFRTNPAAVPHLVRVVHSHSCRDHVRAALRNFRLSPTRQPYYLIVTKKALYESMRLPSPPPAQEKAAPAPVASVPRPVTPSPPPAPTSRRAFLNDLPLSIRPPRRASPPPPPPRPAPSSSEGESDSDYSEGDEVPLPPVIPPRGRRASRPVALDDDSEGGELPSLSQLWGNYDGRKVGRGPRVREEEEEVSRVQEEEEEAPRRGRRGRRRA